MVRKSPAEKTKADQESAYPAGFDATAGRQAGHAGGMACIQAAGDLATFCISVGRRA
jgi:hypothetical protein